MFEAPFKICTVCHQEWQSVTDFLNDPENEIIGYQANFKNLEAGYFLFNHQVLHTLAIPVNAFSHFRSGPIFTENKAGTEDCPGYCIHKLELGTCQESCECRWVRDVIQVIKAWKKAY
jgi:hypothetical protein